MEVGEILTNISPNHVPEDLKVNNSVLPELRLRANQCLVDVLLDCCVKPGTGSGIPGSWKLGRKRNEPQVLDLLG